MSTYTQEVSKILAKAVGTEIGNYSAETLQALAKKINNYLVKLNNWNKKVSVYYNKMAWKDPDMKEELKRYIAVKEVIRINPEIEQLLKEGYALIDLLRETITGEEIRYFIGVEYRGKLYEGYVSMQQILDMAKATPQWKGSLSSSVKLRLSGTNKGALASLLDEVDDFRKNGEGHSTLYSSVKAYASSSGKTNQGNVYEAYRALRARYDSNDIPPAVWDPDEFDTIYMETRKNTGSFVTGGDILNDQIKFFGGSVPSLAALATIRDTLTTFTTSITTLSGPALTQSINELFNNNPIIEEAASSVDGFIGDTIKNKIIPTLKQK